MNFIPAPPPFLDKNLKVTEISGKTHLSELKSSQDYESVVIVTVGRQLEEK